MSMVSFPFYNALGYSPMHTLQVRLDWHGSLKGTLSCSLLIDGNCNCLIVVCSDVILDTICWTLEWWWTCFWLFPTRNDLGADNKLELFPQRGMALSKSKRNFFFMGKPLQFCFLVFLFPLGALVTVLKSIAMTFSFSALPPESAFQMFTHF